MTGCRTDTYDNNDWLEFNFRNGGDILLPALRTLTRKTLWNLEIPDTVFTLPALETADNAHIYLATGGRLELPQVQSMDATYFGISDQATIEAPQLTRLSGSSFSWGFGSTFNAPNLVEWVDSGLGIAFGRNVTLGPLRNIWSSRISVSDGRPFSVVATSYDMRQDWRSSPTIFSAVGPGSMLDLSTLQSVTAWGGYGGSWRYSITADNNGVVDLSGLTTVTGCRTDTYDNNDWLEFNFRNGGDILLPALRTLTRKTLWNLEIPNTVFTLPALETADNAHFYLATGGGLNLPQVQSMDATYFGMSDQATIEAPQLTRLSGSSFGWGFGSTFNAPNVIELVNSSLDIALGRNLTLGPLHNIWSSRISVSDRHTFSVVATSYDMHQDWRSSPTIFSAIGAGSLLDLSTLQSVTAWGGYGGAWRYSITADNNGVIDLSGLTTVTGCRTDTYDNNDWLEFNVLNAGAMRVGSPSTTRRVQFTATGNGTELQVHSPYFRAPATLAVTGQARLRCTGDFRYENTDPNSIVVENAFFQMEGPVPQRLEVGGRDGGPGGFSSRNFGYSQLIVGSAERTSVVRLVDTLNNGNRGSAGEPEALYLYGIDGQGLRVLNGSRLVLNGLNAYAAINGQMQSLQALIPPGTNSVAFDQGYIANFGGPAITNMTPAGALTPSIDAVEITFDLPIQPSSFTVADVQLSGPSGNIPVTSVSLVSGTTWRIRFAAQSADGPYTVRVGPNIDELGSTLNGMDQNGDGLSGEPEEDVFTGTFVIDGAAPQIVGAYALQNGTRVGVTFDEPVDPDFATNAANYSVNGLTPDDAVLMADGTRVALSVAPMVGEAFSLEVTGSRDALGNAADRTATGVILPLESRILGTPGSDPREVGSSVPFSATGFVDRVGGTYIWDSTDRGRFTFESRTADFDVRVRIESLAKVGSWTQAGLMARENANANSRHVYVGVQYGTGYDRYVGIHRQVTSGASAYWPGTPTTLPVPVPDGWMRLKREGDVFFAYRATDGLAWIEYARVTNALPATLLVGMATSANNNNTGQATTASYRDYGDVTPSILTHPQSQSVASGASVTFGVTARGLPALNYQWRFNGSPLPGQTSALLVRPSVTTAQAGDYSVVVSNPYGSVTSHAATLVVDGVGLGGFEADVAPLPGGNNAVTVSDWVRVGRLVAGLESPINSSEFARADCAPRTNAVLGTLPLGDGRLTVADWTQAGRYAAGVDPLTPVGGPTGPVGPASMEPSDRGSAIARSSADQRRLVMAEVRAAAGGEFAVPVMLAALGGENAVGFSIEFDPGRMVYREATLGEGAAGAAIQVNDHQAAQGRLGVVLARPVGESFAPGEQTVLTIKFRAGDQAGVVPLVFADAPVWREIADIEAGVLASSYVDALARIVAPALWSTAVRVSDGEVELQLAGEPGERYRVERSVDLREWSLVTIVTAGPEPYAVRDPAAEGVGHTFYRAVLE